MSKILLFLHVLSAIVAFGPTLLFPLLGRSASPRAAGAVVLKALKVLVVPGLVGLAVFGAGVVGTAPAEDDLSMSAPWVSVAFLAVIAGLGVVAFLLIPAQRRVALAGSDAEASALSKKSAPLLGALHLALLVGLVMMVWQPGQ